MDTNAKCWQSTLSHMQHQPLPSPIPGEGWTIWCDHCKLAIFSWESFDSHSQYLYSQKYWEQPCKLGSLYQTLDWKICGTVWKQFPLAQQLWSTKWLTNGLPVGKNMLHWNLWYSDHCLSCKMEIDDITNILSCPEISWQDYFSKQIAQLEQNLTT